ncbi:MAG: hypothetical protein ABLT11_08200 [Candidatus Acidiferrum sp.]
MLMQSGDRWLCSNAACRAELAVGLSRTISSDHLRCACGAVMLKHPSLPVFGYLDFLGNRESLGSEPQPELQLHNARKE